MLKKKTLKVHHNPGSLEATVKSVRTALQQIASGKMVIVLSLEDPAVVQARRKYYALVSELGRFLGYSSYAERELFKVQIKEELGGESVSDMTEPEQVYIKIEEVYRLAAEQYEYVFPPDDTRPITRNPEEG